MIMIPFTLYEHRSKQVVKTNELFEQNLYVVEFETELSESEINFIQRNYRQILRPFYKNTFLLQFANHVGWVDVLGRRFQVRSRKWSEQNVHQMWLEVSRELASLPFQHLNVARQTYERTPEEQARLRYQQWVFLRDELLWKNELSMAWDSISREPHTQIQEQQRIRHSWEVHRVTDRSWQRLMEGEGVATLPRGHHLDQTRTAQVLSSTLSIKELEKKLFPESILETEKLLTPDTQENRFIKYLIQEMLEVVQWMDSYLISAERAKRTFFRIDEIRVENAYLRNRLQSMLAIPWMRDVGHYQGSHAQSTVLQRRQGYRQWFLFYQEYLRGIRYPLQQQELVQMIESRDISKIYEYWCFFQVLKSVEKATGCSRKQVKITMRKDFEHYLEYGTVVHYTDSKISVAYNRKFRSGIESYSLGQQPDISVWNGVQWFHFDAKFKVGHIRDDIATMHTYKDAIHASRCAIALYPATHGHKINLFPRPVKRKESWEGVGGIWLEIGGENDMFVQLLRLLL